MTPAAKKRTKKSASRHVRGRFEWVSILAIIAVLGLCGWALWNSSAAFAPESRASGVDADMVAPLADATGQAPASAPVAITDAAPAASVPVGISSRVAATWVTRVAKETGIPRRALEAYGGASVVLAESQPECHLGWTTLAALGFIESGHGTHGGTTLLASGFTKTRILGPRLDGGDFAQVHDSDRGAWDGDTEWDHAVGPLQFIPQTWSAWGADGNGDGLADPNQIDDAALAAANYLCASGDLSAPKTWRAAVFSYNHLEKYVNDIAAAANRYGSLAR
ncbi:lytic murein transglycosylase [Glaciihabitans sp. dw_435]|uniref:lytic transglycosylase domain-containing protein n=1 Tax=Glaciihabitans sp. dw_435 TaxID=2720081 RepID=UPI0027DBAD80|nr:lytic murein transglycosylase [Glaciihabitans sp. dw_435]